MKFILYHPTHFERWDYRSSIERGIGGSETNQVEMAWRLARRGHEVISYAPIPDDCDRHWRGTEWRKLEEVDWKERGIWILYRCPAAVDNFAPKLEGQQIWIMEQDEEYVGQWTEERLAKIDRIMPISEPHRRFQLKRYPELASKMWVTANGVKVDLIREIEAQGEPPQRNPNRLMYASSPDRGLKHLLKIFKRAREFNSELELHCFYGFDNIEKLIEYNPKFKHFGKTKEEIKKLLSQPGVVWHGRVSQVELYREWMKTGIWCYPTNFFETGCITSMEAMCLGAIPITNPYGALEQNVFAGEFIQGDAWGDPLVQARYVGEIIRLTTDVVLQDKIRTSMMKTARYRFNWERVIDQWEATIYGMKGFCTTQYIFQHKHAKGRILNIGCDIDISNLKERGAVNVDLLAESPIVRVPTRADVIADARELPESLHKRFDTVILGDILEHLSDEDAVKSIKSAKKCIENGGYVLITCPDDCRPHEAQHSGDVDAYAIGESSFHSPVPKSRLEKWVADAGLSIKHYETLDYTFAEGHAALCC